MGDRRNVIMKDSYSDTEVYLYTHWGGYNLPEKVQTALKKRWRWKNWCYV